MRKLALIATFCLTCVTDTALALGLGGIEVYSSLNQPLRAEVPLFALKPGERAEITAQVAPESAFQRMGIDRNPVLSDLRFRVVEGPSADRAILQITTLQSVREPFLSLLLEIRWAQGRLVREFTILLDPPVLQSGQTKPRPKSDFDRPPSAGTFGQAYEQPRTASAEGGSYGPVKQQETLWSIAYAHRPNDSIPMEQVMQAIYEANPDAFDGSISTIRAGSMLRIPSEAEIRATNAAPARREVARERRAAGTGPAPVDMEDVAPVAPAKPASAPKQPKAEPEPQGELRLSTPGEAETAAPTAPPVGQAAPTTVDEKAPSSPAPPADASQASAKPATAPIEVRDNSAKAIELLSKHAREQSARQAATDQLAQSADTTGAQPVETAEAPKAETPKAEAPQTTEPAPAEPSVQVPPPETAPTAPLAGEPPPTGDSPFVDEQEAQAEAQAPAAATAPPPEAAAEAPPASVDVGQDPAKPAAPAVDNTFPDLEGDAGFNPMLLGLGAAVVLLAALGAARYRKYRAAKASTVELAPIVMSEVDETETESPFASTMEVKEVTAAPPKPAPPVTKTPQAPAATPKVESTLEATAQRTMPPEQTTSQFMAVSTPQPTPDIMPVAVEQSGTIENDPYADALGEVDIHIAYGLYDEAARLLQDPLSKSPERKDLHLKLLEVYFSANMANEFETQAKKMKAVVSGPNDSDWEKACIMGQQLCPESTMFGSGDGSGSGAGMGMGTADLDISSMLADAQATAAPAKPASEPKPAAKPDTGAAASLDLDLSGFDLGVGEAEAAKAPAPKADSPAPKKPADKPAEKPKADKAEADDGNILDFNLDDFSLDTEPAKKEAAPAPQPKLAPEAPKPSASAESAVEGTLDIDLADFDLGSLESDDKSAPADSKGAEQELDDLLMSDTGGGGEAQDDTRLDLARAYIDMGEPTMAKSLLEEVIAQGDDAQKQEAKELLGRLGPA